MTTYWCDNSAVWTHYGNGASIIFPAWEKAFVAVIRYYLPRVEDAKLKERMIAFAREELAHASAHESFNARYELLDGQAKEFRRAKVVHRRPGIKFWLGTMVSIEHLAACMSRSVLHRWGHRSGRDYKLFCWHAKEELGHKSLAIDLWRYLGHSEHDLRKIAVINQTYVLKFLAGYTVRHALANGGSWQWRVWKDLVVWGCFFVGKVLLPALAIYAPKFHPDSVDDTVLMQRYT